MIAIDNKNLKNACCGDGCGFKAVLTYDYNPTEKTLTITDACEFTSGDSLKVVNVSVFDKFGHQLDGQINNANGNVTFNTDEDFNDSKGFNVTATIVSTNGCTKDVALYDVGVIPGNTGAFGVPEDVEESIYTCEVTGISWRGEDPYEIADDAADFDPIGFLKLEFNDPRCTGGIDPDFISYSSASTSYVTVVSKKLHPVAAGTSTITATYNNGVDSPATVDFDVRVTAE